MTSRPRESSGPSSPCRAILPPSSSRVGRPLLRADLALLWDLLCILLFAMLKPMGET
ncbi:hypothetical protein GMOD_00003421 [Pyrenophora seminiperda CCB06]|uniref:Uncharacterized protein n=1 Tax=Pyrenophora seminiperda CCB06 TaxID=1302712 RepID=A0A3M7MIS4_9PLEO|nr:hypothetical protein GMOD_00003421 [Pyrenophora seminiperda CCB06]